MNPRHLCDLLNFVLVLGHHNEWPQHPARQVRIKLRGIDPLVVASWTSKEQATAESWVDRQLNAVSLGAHDNRRRRYTGRIPQQLTRWAPRRFGGMA